MPPSIALAGCGILKKELLYLDTKNGWGLETHFLDSSLHVDFNRLDRALTGTLEKLRGRKVIVLYGTCHPLMDTIVQNAAASRTMGQNCVELLLGKEVFTRELEDGAFFLMEDWVRRWDYVIRGVMGESAAGIRAMIREERTRFIGLRTGCNDDFSAAAEEISRDVGLPLSWMDTGLENLEAAVLQCLDTLKGPV